MFHDDWLRFASGYVNNKIYIEDIVQEMYLKAHRTKNQSALLKDNQPNKTYIFEMLKNMCIDFNRAKSRVAKEYISDSQIESEFPTYGMDIDQIKHHDQEHWEVRNKLRSYGSYYERMYLIITCADRPTYRELSKATGLSASTICKEVKTIKEMIAL